MSEARWFLIFGALFVAVALVGSFLRRAPLTTSIVYLLVGAALGPRGAALFAFEPERETVPFELLTELAILVSLFTAGLKIGLPLRDRRWIPALRLATVSMLLTVGLVAAAGVLLLNLSWGAALVLGSALAPTDPVLAADVQLEAPGDRDRLRFALTAEAGLNDGSAFPFLLLGLGLQGARDLGSWGWKWITFDVIYAPLAGLAFGALLGAAIGRLVVYLRAVHREAIGLDEFLTLGTIALSYGIASAVRASGFLAVFAAGVALRHFERTSDARVPEGERPSMVSAGATPETMLRAVLGFNEQLERLIEVMLVVLVGGFVSTLRVPPAALWFVPLLLFVFRPLSVWLGTVRSPVSPGQRALIGWFGIRGIGSLFYVAYAASHGMEAKLSATIFALVASTVAVSIVVHGVSVTPVMRHYREWSVALRELTRGRSRGQP